MQINGTSGPTVMAASEPPEPPPRNPDRINASLNKLTDSKITKSLDTSDKQVNNNKPLKPILSLDNNTSGGGGGGSGVGCSSSSSGSGGGGGCSSGSNSSESNIPSPMNPTSQIGNNRKIIEQNNISTTISPPSSNNSDINCQRSIMVTAPDLITTTNTNNSSISSITGVGSNGVGGGGGNLSSNTTTNNDLNQYLLTDGPNKLFTNGTTTLSANDINNLYSTIGEKTHKTIMSTSIGGNCNPNSTSSGLAQISISSGGNQTGTINLNGQVLGTQMADDGSPYFDGNRNDDLRFDTDIKDNKDPTIKLRFENEKLNMEIIRLRKLLENSPDGAVGGVDLSDSNSYDAHSTDDSSSRIERLENELKIAKQQITALRIERKKLKSDKSDLLSHVKQLCASLQDKEQELRDFIRNFEQRIRESETSNAKLSTERERERWSLLKHARDEAERSLALAQQLNARDVQLQRTQDQLQEARRQLSGCLSDQESLLSFAPLTPPSGLMSHIAGGGGGTSNNLAAGFNTDRGSCSADSGVRGSSDRESAAGDMNLSDGTCENGPCITVDADSISIVSSQHMYQFGTPKERSPTLSPLNSAAYSRSVEQLGSPIDSEGPSALTRKFPTKTATGTLTSRTGRGGTWGSISRVFARSRNKNKINSSQEVDVQDYTNWSPLTEEGYAEKLRLLREASQIPIDRWRASQVLAWLEVALGMPQYSTRCSENVKSGKVLLELNDAELETGLGLAHPMHRKKLRLAIEEQRRPDLVRYPSIAQLGHTWVASEWLPDIGLPQYAEPFLHSLVDARMLDTLSKKELEKFLGVTRKFHQASIVHGIHVLRIVKYDRQTLAMRRLQSENVDADPIVWTNQRFIRWARSIDLGEYADNLKDSGVHGGLVVLEPSFSGDTMATALGIPPSKNIIRRHLSTEFDALVLPARATLGQGIRSGCGVVPITGPGGLQHHYATTDRRSSGSLRISAWKGSQSSLSKAFRFNTKSRTPSINDKTTFGNSTSPTPSYSSSESSGLYATIGHPLLPPPTTAPPPPPPSHRVSAPPTGIDILPYDDHNHRRVKSISDIEIVAAPV